MISIETFDFDIISLIIVFFSIVFGAYYGMRRELRHFISLVLPFFLLHLVIEKLYFIINTKTPIIKVINKALSLININNNYLTFMIFFVLCYLIIYIIIFNFLKIFRKKKEKRLLHQETKKTRIIGGMIGVVKGYFIAVFTLIFVSSAFVINYNRPITKFLFSTSSKFSYLVEYEEYKYYQKTYNSLKEEIEIITGEEILNIYQEIIIDEKFNDYVDISTLNENEVLKYFLKFYYENLKDNKENFYYSEKVLMIEKFFSYQGSFVNKARIIKSDETVLAIYNEKIKNIIATDAMKLINAILENDDFKEQSLIYLLIKNIDSCPNNSDLAYEIMNANFSNFKNKDKIYANNIVSKMLNL